MKIPWTTILLIVVAILVTLQLKSCLDKTPPNEKMIKSDMKIEELNKKVIADSVALKEERHKSDSVIALSDERFMNLVSKRQPIINVIKQTPVTVSNLDKEQLRSGSKDFYNTNH